MMNNGNNDSNRWRGFILGTLGSIAGLWAMRTYWQQIAPQIKEKIELGGTDVYPERLELDDISVVEREPDPDKSSTAVVGSMAYEAAAGQPPQTDETENMLSYLVHWGYGLLQGGLYGVARVNGNSKRGLDIGGGAAFGAGLWLLGDEMAVPMLGLQEGPTAVSPAGHINRLGAHLVYGIATAAATQILGRVF